MKLLEWSTAQPLVNQPNSTAAQLLPGCFCRLQDQYVSVEELLQAMADDPRFGAELFQQQGLGRDKLEEVIQEIRGGKT